MLLRDVKSQPKAIQSRTLNLKNKQKKVLSLKFPLDSQSDRVM